MVHTVTLEEVLPALETEIVLSSSYSGKTRKAKNLKYNISQNRYRVRFHDKTNNTETSNSFDDILEAIEKYNSYNA